MIMKHFSGIAYLIYGFIVTAIIIVVLITNTHASEVKAEDIEPQDAFTVGMNPMRDYLVLVNEEHEYEFGGEYDKALQSDLIYVSDCDGLATPVEKGAYLAFGMLKADLHRLGFDIELYSAYRNKEDQQWVYDNYSNLSGWSEHNSVLPAGLSEHHTGLVISYVVWWPDEDQPSQSVWYEITAELTDREEGIEKPDATFTPITNAEELNAAFSHCRDAISSTDLGKKLQEIAASATAAQ